MQFQCLLAIQVVCCVRDATVAARHKQAVVSKFAPSLTRRRPLCCDWCQVLAGAWQEFSKLLQELRPVFSVVRWPLPACLCLQAGLSSNVYTKTSDTKRIEVRANLEVSEFLIPSGLQIFNKAFGLEIFCQSDRMTFCIILPFFSTGGKALAMRAEGLCR